MEIEKVESGMVRHAVQHYHDLLSKRHFTSTVEQLESQRQSLSVAGRPVCTVLRPCLITESLYSRIKKASAQVMNGIVSLCRLLMEETEVRRALDLSEAEEAIIRIDTGYGLPDVSARLDGFLSDSGELKFVEYNSDSPGGIGYGDVLGEVFASMPVTKEFAQRYPYYTIPVRSLVFENLINAYHRWGGKGLPAIGIIDWKDAVTFSEFVLFQKYFEKHGCRVKIGDPRDLEYRNGKLYLNGFHIELVYKRLVVGEMLERLGADNALTRATRERSVCVANGFPIQLAFRKILFALLSERVHSNLFDTDTRKAILGHIPWTRRVQEGRTQFGTEEVELIPFIRENRDNLVLKPAGEYGGKGVFLGWKCSPDQWDGAIQIALSQSYVAQERVGIGREVYPSSENGTLVFTERYFDLDPYVWNGQDIEGCGVRLSQSPLLNVSAGGGSGTPLFILRD